MTLEKKPIIENKKVNSYLKYSGIGFQLIAVILIGVFVGKYLDKRFQNDTPYFTAGLILVLLVVFLIKLIHDLSAENKSEK